MKKISMEQKIAIFTLITSRFILIVSQPLEGVKGYGDLQQLFNISSIPGWPFLDHWSEYPPLFPFFSKLLNLLSSGQPHVYIYLMVILLTIIDVLSLVNFWRISRLVKEDNHVSDMIFLLGMVILPYYWWYFDNLGILFLLLGLRFVFEDKKPIAVASFLVGFLIKVFPVFGLVPVLRLWKRKQVLLAILAFGIGVGVVYGGLYLLSPKYLTASVFSQFNKGSWQTVWAWLDGNLTTGNFGPLIDRMDANLAYQSIGKPSVISPWLTLLIFLPLGLWRLLRLRSINNRQTIALIGFTFCLFFLWSPGWSPQWVLFLLPLLFLTFETREAVLFAAVLVFVNLLEWPVLLSRGMFYTLPLTIVVRTIVIALAAVKFDQVMNYAGLSLESAPAHRE